MATLRVPKKNQSGLAKYINLNEETFGSVITTLENLPFALQFMEPLRKGVRSVEGIPPADASSIGDALVSLYAAWSTSDRSSADFISDIVEGIIESNSDELAQFRESKERVWTRLTRLFEIPSLTLAVKAEGFLFEFDNIFKSTRVLTDVRPVFDQDGKAPRALTVVHNLRIHYHRGDKHEDFFVALDSKDLQKLIDSLVRAKDRSEALKTALAITNIPYIEPE
jgi:hypothetical protein